MGPTLPVEVSARPSQMPTGRHAVMVIGQRLASLPVTDSPPEPTTPPTVLDATHPDPVVSVPELDLDTVERDLAAVETALQRLSDGTYWTDEVTGEPIAEHVLAADPTARRA